MEHININFKNKKLHHQIVLKFCHQHIKGIKIYQYDNYKKLNMKHSKKKYQKLFKNLLILPGQRLQ